MTILFAWLLVASSAFISIFYLTVHKNLPEEENYAAPENWPKVSVLIPAYNEESVVKSSLENILNTNYPNYEVIFINDNSTDETLQKAQSFEDEKLEIIDLDENKGKAGALNKGLEKAKGKYCVVQDADSIVEEGIIEEAASKLSANPNLGAVIGRIQPLKQNSFFRKLQINEYTVTNFYRSLMSRIGTLDVTPGPFSIYRTEDLKEIDGFDEGNLTEDLDMAWRLRKQGKNLDMVYQKTSQTELPKNFSQLKGQRVRWVRGFFQNAVKHTDMFFNSKYGWFGNFQLPIRTILPVLGVLGVVMMAYGALGSLYNMYLNISATGLSFAIPQLTLWETLLGIQWKIYIPLVASLITTGYVVRLAYISADRSVKHPGSLMFYFFAFFAANAYFWSIAFFKELFRRSRVWT